MSTVMNEHGVFRALRVRLRIASGEGVSVALSFAAGLSLFAAYALLRPVREAMGVSSGVAALPALFWATFGGILVVQALYGRLLMRLPRTRVLAIVFGATIVSLVAFNVWFHCSLDHSWIARTYFVWISVFNLFLISTYWSVMADVFSSSQATRLFGILAASLSMGGLLGARLATDLAVPLGTPNLLLIAAGLLGVSGLCIRQVVRGRTADGTAERDSGTVAETPTSLWASLRTIAGSPYLRQVALFVLLLSAANTVLYIEQNRIVGASALTPDQRTALFGAIDFWVQVLALAGQLFLFGPLAKRLGARVLLALTPALMIPVFGLLALAPGITVVIGAMLCRRVGEYAFTKPARDMLFTVVPADQKYAAKNMIDSFVYRGGDAASASLLQATVGAGGALAGLAGMAVCASWLANAWRIGTLFGRKAA